MNPTSPLGTPSRELLGLIIEAMPSGIVVIDSSGVIVLVNRKTESLFQAGRQDLLGRPIELLIPERFHARLPFLRPDFFAAPQECTLGGDHELFARRKDGSEFPVEIGLNSISTQEGNFVVADVADQSERHRAAEEEVQAQRIAALDLAQEAEEARKRAEQTEERLNLALSSSGVGTWSWDVVENLIIWDDFIHPLFGLIPGTFPGHYDDFLQLVHPGDRERVAQEVARSIDEDTPHDTEFRVVWPDQSVHTLGSRGKVYRDSEGRAVRMTGVCWDITERKRLEERFRAAVDAAPTAMVMVNEAGVIVLTNRKMEEKFGYRRNELIGRQVEVLLPERFRSGHPALRANYFQHPIQRVMGEGLDLFGVREDGSEFPINVGLSPVETADGPAVICGVMDITIEKKALEAMRQAKEAAVSANLAKSSFLANMSHEIRTPMNGIIGMCQLLAQTELRSHQREYLATVDESAHILLRLLNDILDFSKIEAGKLELECLNFSLSECLARASQMLVLRAAEKGIEIACRIDPEIPDHLRGDSGRLQQVLVNLLGNAVKFTEVGEIFVNINALSITHDQVRLHFSVSDTGIGIPAEKQNQIFRAFEQAESSTTRRFGGTGLGLTISWQLVSLMHGRMWVESDPGRGSTFHFTADFGISPDQHLHAPAELASLRGLPVLVVDDNSTNRRILSEMLQYWQMQPVTADSAEAARRALQDADVSQHPIRLILLDHHMPGEDGIHFVESVRGILQSGTCPIIMISSGSLPVDAELCQKHGICRLMTKPINASELLNEVLRQFGRYQKMTPSGPPAEMDHALTQPRRVLLVEDNEINRRVALGLLHSRGHQVVFAENGEEALIQLAQQEFDVVLMDMQMPVMDGYEATIAIRKGERHAGGHIPIVAMTAEALKGDRERCLAVGMDDYVAKPITPAELYRAVERFPALCLEAHAGPLSDFPRDRNHPISNRLPQLRTDPLQSAISEHATSEHEEARQTPLPQEPTGSAAVNHLPVIDWKIAKERLGDESELLGEFSDLLKSQTLTLMADIHRAIETRNFKLLRLSAHTLKGSVANFGAEPLVQAALALENLARSDSLKDITQLLAMLEFEVARVMAALEIGPPD